MNFTRESGEGGTRVFIAFLSWSFLPWWQSTCTKSKRKREGGIPRIELGTARTLSENHITTPNAFFDILLNLKGKKHGNCWNFFSAASESDSTLQGKSAELVWAKMKNWAELSAPSSGLTFYLISPDSQTFACESATLTGLQ